MEREPTTTSQEYLLLDYAQRIERHREGRRAVHIHLSELNAHNRREHHIRIAKSTFEELVKQFDGQIFHLQNTDIVFVCRGATLSAIDAAVNQLRVLFSDDPLSHGLEEGEDDPFCTYFSLERQFPKFLAVAEGVYEDEQKRQRRLRAAEQQSGEADGDQRDPLSPDQLGKLVDFLQRADLSSVMRRQSICAVQGESPPRPIFKELFISIAELAQQVLPDVNLAANRWLFQHLTETLDLRMLRVLSQADDRDLLDSFSVNLNVATLLAPEFQEFDSSLRAGSRGTIVVELQLLDIFADVKNYMFARDFLREKGYRICLDGVTHHSLSMIDRQALGADLVKLAWLPEMSEGLAEEAQKQIVEQIDRAGKARVILARCDNAGAVRYGQEMGLTMFQGRHLDAVLHDAAQRRAAERRATPARAPAPVVSIEDAGEAAEE
jgi:EAL domain-containing protein (putative c-di-GMP-specific phosphodiesterase class I)